MNAIYEEFPAWTFTIGAGLALLMERVLGTGLPFFVGAAAMTVFVTLRGIR